jgi:hypothetical protein
MKDAPAFDFYPERWTHGTRGMSKTERSDFLDLLCYQWTEDGLPANSLDLARLCGYREARTLSIKVVEKFPVSTDGKRRNERLEVIRNEQRKRIEDRRRGAMKTNAQRALSVRSAGRERLAEGVADATPPPTTHPKTASQSRPRAPTLQEWQEFSRGLTPPFPPSESERAWNHYESNGWRVGKNPVKKWEACCRKCHLNWKSQSYSPNGKPNSEIPRNQRDPIYDKAPIIRIVPESDRPSIDEIKALKHRI